MMQGNVGAPMFPSKPCNTPIFNNLEFNQFEIQSGGLKSKLFACGCVLFLRGCQCVCRKTFLHAAHQLLWDEDAARHLDACVLRVYVCVCIMHCALI